MKRYIITACFGAMLVFFSSCKKDGASRSIVGTWELRQAQNGMTPTINYSPGNGNILKFSNSTYENYTNNNLVKSGHYIIIKDASVITETGLVIPSGQFTDRIVYDSDFVSRKTFIEISNNSLIFLSGFFPTDGGSDIKFERKANNR